jgi:CheY-like chemotaxis protein
VVEDSIVGRIFLQRLLESQGFAVESLASASELRHAQSLERWAAMFVDVALPDSPRGEHLKSLAHTSAIALVRDAHDERLAAAAGLRFALRKPFERADLLRVLEALGLQGETA